MGVPRGINTLPPGAAVGDPVELKRAFQDQLRRELGARAGDIHSTLGDRRVARAPSRKMTAAGAPGAQYILDGDVRARQTLEPALGLPQLTAVKLATFADDVESRVGREKQSADWAASADAASGAPGLTKPDVKLGAGGSGGGARAFRFRKAVYGAPRDAAPGASARERAAADPPGFRAARGTTTIAFPGGDAFIRSRGAPARGGRFRARPASGARGKHKPRVSRAWNREPALSGAPTPANEGAAATEAAAPPADHFPTSASAVAADAPWPKPITPDAPPEKKRVPASLLSGRSRARGRAAPRPARLAAGQPDARARLAARAVASAAAAARASRRDAKADRLAMEALHAALYAYAAALPEGSRNEHAFTRPFRDAIADAEALLAAARGREAARRALDAAVTRNQPSSFALAEAREKGGLAEDDPAVLAMRACLNRAAREARARDETSARRSGARLVARRAEGDGSVDGSVGAEERSDSGGVSNEAEAERTNEVVGRGSLLGAAGTLAALRVVELVGEGAYGRVMRCADAATESRFCAVKEFKIHASDPDVEEVRRTSEREVRALRSLDHPNIVKHLGDFYQNDKLYVAMEFVPRTLLQILQAAERDADFFDARDDAKTPDVLGDDQVSVEMRDAEQTANEPPPPAGGLPAEEVRRYVFQLCLALAYLHARGYVYRDVKPENLLVGDDGVLKLCDFGFARELPGAEDTGDGAPLTDYVATRWYRAPELLLGQPYRAADGVGGVTRAGYGQPVDMWAVGCLAGELRDGEPMFPGENDVDQLRLVQRCLGRLTPGQMMAFSVNPHNAGVTFPEDELGVFEESLPARYGGVFDDVALDFVRGLLELNPRQRRTGAACLEHPYFQGLR